jgi:isoleucyl-tRNA synthetase
MSRVPEVLDCWFDSGSMPFAQWHYPFENKEKIDSNEQFPADFISEAIDQTRGWFYTLLAVSTLLDRGPSYKNVICLGHLRDAKGEKMSKSKGNVVAPWDVINQYGSDAVRWYFYTINQPGDPKNFNLADVDAIVKKFFLILFNVLSFYKLYAQGNTEVPQKVSNVLDEWILARLNLLIKETTHKLDNYDVVSAARGISDFVNELSTWYLRRSRERFKEGGKKQKEALDTLYFALMSLSKLIAPFIPFSAEKIYQEILRESISVHLESWPEAKEDQINEKLFREMEQARKVVEMVHAIRAEAKIKVRQPLSSLEIEGAKISPEILQIVLDEVNIKQGRLIDHLEPKENYISKNEGGVGVSVSIELTEELKREGILREIIRHINDLRKEARLTINDKVNILLVTPDPAVRGVIAEFQKEIRSAVIGGAVKLVETKAESSWQHETEINGESFWIGLSQ